jgi:hypothetical protein
MSEPEYVFDQVQIGKGLKPLAQHGFITVGDGTLTLLGSDRAPIDSAPLSEITASMVRFTRGQTVSLTLGGVKYNASPGWGNQSGSLMMAGDAKQVKTAAALLVQIIEQGRQ